LDKDNLKDYPSKKPQASVLKFGRKFKKNDINEKIVDNNLRMLAKVIKSAPNVQKLDINVS